MGAIGANFEVVGAIDGAISAFGCAGGSIGGVIGPIDGDIVVLLWGYWQCYWCYWCYWSCYQCYCGAIGYDIGRAIGGANRTSCPSLHILFNKGLKGIITNKQFPRIFTQRFKLNYHRITRINYKNHTFRQEQL